MTHTEEIEYTRYLGWCNYFIEIVKQYVPCDTNAQLFAGCERADCVCAEIATHLAYDVIEKEDKLMSTELEELKDLLTKAKKNYEDAGVELAIYYNLMLELEEKIKEKEAKLND